MCMEFIYINVKNVMILRNDQNKEEIKKDAENYPGYLGSDWNMPTSSI